MAEHFTELAALARRLQPHTYRSGSTAIPETIEASPCRKDFLPCEHGVFRRLTMRSKLTHALGTGAEFALALWRTMKRRRLATITVLVCVLFVLGGEPRKAAALVRKYHAVLWIKPPPDGFTTTLRLGRELRRKSLPPIASEAAETKVVVQPLPPGGFPNDEGHSNGRRRYASHRHLHWGIALHGHRPTVGATNDYDLPADTTNPTMTGAARPSLQAPALLVHCLMARFIPAPALLRMSFTPCLSPPGIPTP